MASAKQLPSGSWRVQAKKTIDGKQIRKSFVVSPKDCGGSDKKAILQAELLAREWMLDAELDAHRTTVKQAFETYIDNKRNVLSPSTIADYERMPKHFEEILMIDINDITSKVIQAIINDFAIKGLSAKTIKNRINFLTTSLNFAGVDKRFRLTMPKAITPDLLPPEPSEFSRLLSMASPEEKLTIILAGLYTLRRGEIGGLCGEDLLWDLNSIYVHSSRVKDSNKKWIRRNMPKNLNSVRVIQIDPEIMKLFPKVGPKEYVIDLTPDAITRRFERLAKKACVNCRFHDLRKYAASIRSEIMPSKYVEADGGWKKDSKVMRTIYDKPFKEKRNEYSKLFNKKVVNEYASELFDNLGHTQGHTNFEN